MKLEKAIKVLNDYKDGKKEMMKETLVEAIETVLKENKKLKEKELDYTTVYMNGFFEGKEYYKNKIKDKIKELDYKAIKIYTSNKKYYYETDKYNDIIKQILQELLKED